MIEFKKFMVFLVITILLILILSGLNIISVSTSGLVITYPSLIYFTDWLNSDNFIMVVSLIFMFLMFYYIFYYKENTRGRR